MKKEHLDKFIEDVDVLRMPIREIIATAYELGRLHEKTGVDKEEREAAMEEIRRMSKPHPVKVTPKTICAMYCLGFEECPEFKNNNEIEKCGCYAVLKDRHREEVLNVMKGEKL